MTVCIRRAEQKQEEEDEEAAVCPVCVRWLVVLFRRANRAWARKRTEIGFLWKNKLKGNGQTKA